MFTTTGIFQCGVFLALQWAGIVLCNSSEEPTLNSQERSRRSNRCLWKYKTLVRDHSACLLPSSHVVEKGLDDDDIETILDIHNKVRRQVTPKAANMMIMTWDEEIAHFAQRWAENCEIRHEPDSIRRYAFGRFSVSQNIAWNSGRRMTWSGAIQMWIDEKKDFRYGWPATGIVAHYTQRVSELSGCDKKRISRALLQMIWADTTKLGCGYAKCEDTQYFVCNYAPKGNLDLQQMRTPYKSSRESCSDCPDNCEDGLCSCIFINNVCYNDGRMDVRHCVCNCKDNLPFYIVPDCALDCTAGEDPDHCRKWDKQKCGVYSNLPLECPHLCGWCPAASLGFLQLPYNGSTTVCSTWTFGILALLWAALAATEFPSFIP